MEYVSNEECNEAFEELKRRSITPMLSIVGESRERKIYSNVSDQGLQCMLIQHERSTIIYQVRDCSVH